MAKETGSKLSQKVGFWVFLVGVLIALLAGLFDLGPGWVSVLVVLGLLVGFLNVTASETTPFLLAVVSLVIVTSLGGDVVSSVQVVGTVLSRMLHAIVIFVAPATLVVALRAIYSLAKD